MKVKLITVLAIISVLGACKAKKNSAGSSVQGPTENQLTLVKTKIPATTMEELKQGHSIYYGACTNCHGAKKVSSFSEERLRETIDKMAPKAKLSETEKDAVWKYALAVNLSSK